MKQTLFQTKNRSNVSQILLVLLLITTASLYGQVPKLQINEIAQKADLIFIGTVEQQQCRKGINNKVIFTDVTFKDIEVISSTPASLQKNSSRIVLTHAGGTYNDTTMSVSNMPRFRNNERYLMFTQDDGEIYANPMIGGHQGLFSIIVDNKKSEEYILTSSGKAILLLEIDEMTVTNGRVTAISAGKCEYHQNKGLSHEKFINSPPQCSNPSDKTSARSYVNTPAGNPLTKEQFIDFIINEALIIPVIEQQLNLNDSRGYYYFKDENGEIRNRKIEHIAPSINQEDVNYNYFSFPIDTSEAQREIELPYNSKKSSKDENTDSVTKSKKGGVKDISGGTLGYCGYQVIPLVMEQVPTSFWEYNIYNNNMSDWNQVMAVYYYSANDGYGANNGTNEFVNALSNSNALTYYGFNWNGALAMCCSWADGNCGQIFETDLMYNSGYSWTSDPDYAICNTSVWLLTSIMMHELGHSWGEQREIYVETYDYDQLTVMQGGSHYIYETGRGIHWADAYLFRLAYDDQTSIKSTVDVGVESYYASNGNNYSTTNYSSYYPGNQITLHNVSAENISYNAVSDVRVRFYLSTNRIISTSDYQIGGSNSYLNWTSFNGESYSVFDYTSTIPYDVPPGTYYVGAIITVNGFNNDDYTLNNTTSFTYPVTILSLPTYSVTTYSNPSSYGTTNGGGTYYEGQLAEIYANPNIGYNFTNWTENGYLVSTDPYYTFNVYYDRYFTANFEQAYTTIAEIQGYTNTSPYNNQIVSTHGIVTAAFDYGYFIQDGQGSWNGIYIYDSQNNPSLGDHISIIGQVYEYYNLTQIKNISAFYTISTGNALPNPTIIGTQTVNSEEYEGVLVKVMNAQCVNSNAGYGEWIVNDGSGSCKVDDLGYAYSAVNNEYYNVTGVVHYTYDEFKIEPRDANDITLISSVSANELIQGSIEIFPNPSNKTIIVKGLQAGQIEIIDINGKVVKNIDVLIENTSIDISKLSCGVYTMRIITDDGTIIRQLVKE